MKKIYFFIMPACFLLASTKVLSQCRLASPKTVEICNNSTLHHPIYLADSVSNTITNIIYERPAVPGLTSKPLQVSNAFSAPVQIAYIDETLVNTTSQPIDVIYTFTIFLSSPNCFLISRETVKVTVNPTPVINPVVTTPYCNGASVKGINFSSKTDKAFFTWHSDRNIGFKTDGRDSIPAFIATTNNTDTITANITVSIAVGNNNQCSGPNLTFPIVVYPSPPKPGFTSLLKYSSNDTLNVCSGSENINFSINSLSPALAYNWASSPSSSRVFIRDPKHANTVISFRDTVTNTPVTDIISVTATDLKGCTSTASQVVKVSSAPAGTDKRKIFLSQPGNLLIYPDNSFTAYQWGYDTIVHYTASDSSYSSSIPVEGQVYQFFVPNGKFIDSRTSSLNETKYFYWVMLRNGNCTTKVYYNGPYANRVIQTLPAANTLQLKITPNPNKGAFEISLDGNMYGNIHAEIYNATGRIVISKNFTKITSSISERMNTNNLPAGLYYLVLYSSDLKRISSRFVIQH